MELRVKHVQMLRITALNIYALNIHKHEHTYELVLHGLL